MCHFQTCTWTNLAPDGKLSAENSEQNQIICQISLWLKRQMPLQVRKTKIVHGNIGTVMFQQLQKNNF